MTLPLTRAVCSGPRWYAGDFHAHSLFSDGVLPPAEVADLARAGGLDFMCATDHNTVDGHAEYGEPDDLLVVPGIEVTLPDGHFNVFGAIAAEDDWLAQLPANYPPVTNPQPDIASGGLIRQLRQLGLKSSINHPMSRSWGWWDGSARIADLSFLEVWNDPTWPDNRVGNRAAFALWTELLNAGHRVTAVGGSDFHNPDPTPYFDQGVLGGHQIHMPTTYVHAAELSTQAILDAALAGKAYVSVGPQVEFTAEGEHGTAGIGGELGAADRVGFAIAVRGPGPLTLQLIHNGDVVRELSCGELIHSELEHDPETDSGWYRVDVLDDVGEVLAFTNPMFHGKPLPRRGGSYGEFVDYGALAAREYFPPLHS